MCLAIMACAVCWKKVLMENPLNVLVGIWGILGNFAKVSDRQRLGANVGFSFKSFKRPSESIFFRWPFVLLND